MSISEINTLNEESRQRMAAEVLELGESLFETALEVRKDHLAEDLEGEALPVEELQATAQEFFTALRLLLRIEE